MYSISKLAVNEETARAIVAHIFGPEVRLLELTELTEGFYNAAYALDLSDGRRVVLKIAPPDAVRILRYERQIMYTEVDVMRRINAETSLPLPAIYGFDTRRTLLESPYYVMEYVPGTALHKLRPDLSPEEQEPIDRAMGTYLRQINAITGPAFGYLAPGSRQDASWRDAFLAMLDDVLADGEALQVQLPLTSDELRRRIAPHVAALDEVAMPRLVHWDLWDGNIFVDPETKEITGIIDFERALWGDPLMEFQFALGPSRSFIQGYGRSLLDTPASLRRRSLYSIYLYLIIVIESYYREYEDRTLETWARAQLDQELASLAEAGGAGTTRA